MKTSKILVTLTIGISVLACSKDNIESTDTVNTADQMSIVEWQQSLGGSGSEALYDIHVTQNNRYLMVGFSDSNVSGDKTEDSRGGGDMWSLLTDQNGNVIWNKTMGGLGGESARSAVESTDGGFIIGGYSNSDISGDKLEPGLGGSDVWVIKLDPNGNEVWQNALGGSGSDYVRSMVATTDGGVLVVAVSNSNTSADKTENTVGDTGNFDYWVIKLDANGQSQWENTIGGSGDDLVESVVTTPDGGYLIGGSSDSAAGFDKTSPNLGSFDYWLVKINASGEVVWDQTYDAGNSHDVINSIEATSDGGYVLGGTAIGGTRQSNAGQALGSDYWIVKIGSSGNLEWEQRLGGNVDDFCRGVIETAEGRFIAAGWSASGISGDKTIAGYGNADYWLLELDPSGNLLSQSVIGTPEVDDLRVIRPTSNTNFIIGGFTQSDIAGDKSQPSNGGLDYWVLELNSAF